MSIDLHGASAVVTGGGSGLGAATAAALAERGARVVIADVNQEAGNVVANELDGAVFVPTDVTDAQAMGFAIEKAAALGPLRAAVGCAGIGTAGRVLGRHGPMALDAFAKCVQVNLVGMFNLARLAAAAMSEVPGDELGGRGVIVMTASIAAMDGQIGQAAYAASKSGIVGMTLPLARELAKFGVRVVTIAPGLFNTPMLAGVPDELRASLAAQVPFPSRLGDPNEFAALALHAIDNGMLNGTTVRLDGALRMTPQ